VDTSQVDNEQIVDVAVDIIIPREIKVFATLVGKSSVQDHAVPEVVAGLAVSEETVIVPSLAIKREEHLLVECINGRLRRTGNESNVVVYRERLRSGMEEIVERSRGSDLT